MTVSIDDCFLKVAGVTLRFATELTALEHSVRISGGGEPVEHTNRISLQFKNLRRLRQRLLDEAVDYASSEPVIKGLANLVASHLDLAIAIMEEWLPVLEARTGDTEAWREKASALCGEFQPFFNVRSVRRYIKVRLAPEIAEEMETWLPVDTRIQLARYVLDPSERVVFDYFIGETVKKPTPSISDIDEGVMNISEGKHLLKHISVTLMQECPMLHIALYRDIFDCECVAPGSYGNDYY